MVVAVASPIISYVGTGGASAFSFPFPIFLSSQLLVTVINSVAGSFTLVLGTDYNVSGLNPAGTPASTGSITLVNSGQQWLITGNLATGWSIIIQSAFPYAQLTSIRNQGDFDRGALEDALDNLEYQIQQIPLKGPVLVDIVTGFTYQLLIVNGILSQQRLT